MRAALLGLLGALAIGVGSGLAVRREILRLEAELSNSKASVAFLQKLCPGVKP